MVPDLCHLYSTPLPTGELSGNHTRCFFKKNIWNILTCLPPYNMDPKKHTMYKTHRRQFSPQTGTFFPPSRMKLSLQSQEVEQRIRVDGNSSDLDKDLHILELKTYPFIPPRKKNKIFYANLGMIPVFQKYLLYLSDPWCGFFVPHSRYIGVCLFSVELR